MTKNITELFPEGVLTEDTLKAIETTFNDRLGIHIEKALAEQDELYANKLQTLLEAIEKDHTSKLVKVVEAIDKNNSQKLINVAKKYEAQINEEAKSFKSTLVDSISNYIELYIEEAIPAEDIKQAVKNKQAYTVLEGLRKNLAVDTALMQESVRDAVVDGKQTIDSQKAEIDMLKKENTKLLEAYNTVATDLFLEKQTVDMADKKKEYLRKLFEGKSVKFIKENFNYTSKLFDKKETERLEVLKEEAFEHRTVKADAPKEVIVENKNNNQKSVNPLMNQYLSELNK